MVNKSSDRKWWQRSQLYANSAITSDQYTYFDGGDIAERHPVASSFLACQRFQIHAEQPVGQSTRTVLINGGIALPDDNSIGSSEPPRPIAHHRHNPKSTKVTTATRPKSAKATVAKRTAISASDIEPHRLKAFGRLRRALNSTDCEV
ncbi:hypothetical protein [Bradyrhizobium sp. STM 3562]|uniref:hypothetical protein n=1 Tax=Bradyrhizobium sp. STM 3562 TaxID=578924 RepID=UPI00388E9B40